MTPEETGMVFRHRKTSSAYFPRLFREADTEHVGGSGQAEAAQ
jgi:hypothetical protein